MLTCRLPDLPDMSKSKFGLDMATAGQSDFLGGLAASRLPAPLPADASPMPGGLPIARVERDRSEDGRLRLQLSLGCAESSRAVAHTLLAAFAEATTTAQRAREAQALPRCLEITLPAGGGSSQPLVVQLSATSCDPEAEAAVEEAARLFEVRVRGGAVL